MLRFTDGEPRLGPLLSGGEIVLDGLGRPGSLLRRPLRRFVTTSFYDWSEVRRVESTAVTLVLGSEGVVARERSEVTTERAGDRRYAPFSRLPVVDPSGAVWRVMDVRVTQATTGHAPDVLGLIVDSRNPLHLLGLKRSDTVTLPLVPIGREARFLPAAELQLESRRIAVGRPFAEYPLLAEAPDPGPPPRPQVAAG
jgi:hypothetical protein